MYARDDVRSNGEHVAMRASDLRSQQSHLRLERRRLSLFVDIGIGDATGRLWRSFEETGLSNDNVQRGLADDRLLVARL